MKIQLVQFIFLLLISSTVEASQICEDSNDWSELANRLIDETVQTTSFQTEFINAVKVQTGLDILNLKFSEGGFPGDAYAGFETAWILPGYLPQLGGRDWESDDTDSGRGILKLTFADKSQLTSYNVRIDDFRVCDQSRFYQNAYHVFGTIEVTMPDQSTKIHELKFIYDLDKQKALMSDRLKGALFTCKDEDGFQFINVYRSASQIESYSLEIDMREASGLTFNGCKNVENKIVCENSLNKIELAWSGFDPVKANVTAWVMDKNNLFVPADFRIVNDQAGYDYNGGLSGNLIQPNVVELICNP